MFRLTFLEGLFLLVSYDRKKIIKYKMTESFVLKKILDKKSNKSPKGHWMKWDIFSHLIDTPFCLSITFRDGIKRERYIEREILLRT
jgi:hypothetical protein